MMNSVMEVLVSLFVVVGAIFALLGSIGLNKLPDIYTRLHAPTKVSTLGIGGIAIGSLLYFSSHNGTLIPRELLLTLFLFITAPVSAHLLAKAALHRHAMRAEKDSADKDV